MIEHHFDLFRLELLADLAPEYAVVELSKENFIRLRNFIIETQDIGLALDLSEQELNLHSFIIFLKGLNENIEGCLSSITYLEMLRDFRYEIYKWACFHANRIGSTIDCEIKRRQEVTSLIAENLDSIYIKYHPQTQSTISILEDPETEETFDSAPQSNGVTRAYSKAVGIGTPKDPVSDEYDLKAEYDARHGAPSDAAPKVFMKWFFVDTTTGEVSGEQMALAQLTATDPDAGV